MDDYTRMLGLIAQLEELDPEHGDSNCFLNFLDEYAPEGWQTDTDFDMYAFRDEHPAEYCSVLEDYMEDML